MSDTIAAPTPTDPPPSTLSDPVPIPAAVPVEPAAEPAATPVAPTEPPPVSAEPPAGVMPPADAPIVEPAAEAPPVASPGTIDAAPSSSEPVPASPPAVEESQPVTEPVVTSSVVDTPAAAIATLGDDAGIRAPEVPVAESVEPEPEHPHTTLQRLREKLAAYGEECLKAIQQEVEALHNFFDKI